MITLQGLLSATQVIDSMPTIEVLEAQYKQIWSSTKLERGGRTTGQDGTMRYIRIQFIWETE